MTRLADASFAWVRGFGYQPGYAATGLEIWRDFRADQVERELSRGKELFPGMTAVRAWLSFDAFIADGKRFVKHFDAFMDITGKVGVKVMPCLFNNWHSIPDFGGVAAEMVRYWSSPERDVNHFHRYLDAFAEGYARDERIFAWDLCNEPFNSGREEVFLPWLKDLRDHLKARGATAPVTIGVPPSIEALQSVEPLCDLLSPHLYEKSAANDAIVELANRVRKPMIAGETGWGNLDDGIRMEILDGELSALTRRDIGFLIHELGHSLVADCHRPAYGPVSEVGFMGCIEADGSLRPGHGAIRRYFNEG
jgi:hypothetical protein